jgi:hypothetical protein
MQLHCFECSLGNHLLLSCVRWACSLTAFTRISDVFVRWNIDLTIMARHSVRSAGSCTLCVPCRMTCFVLLITLWRLKIPDKKFTDNSGSQCSLPGLQETKLLASWWFLDWHLFNAEAVGDVILQNARWLSMHYMAYVPEYHCVTSYIPHDGKMGATCGRHEKDECIRNICRKSWIEEANSEA